MFNWLSNILPLSGNLPALPDEVKINNRQEIVRPKARHESEVQYNAWWRETVRYGDFLRTEAVLPMYNHPSITKLKPPIAPREGFSLCRGEVGEGIVSIKAAVSADKLFEVFIDLCSLGGKVVNAGLFSEHMFAFMPHRERHSKAERAGTLRYSESWGTEDQLWRDYIDFTTLHSSFSAFKDLILNDGLAAFNVTGDDCDVFLDSHKLIHVSGPNLKAAAAMLTDYGVKKLDNLKFVNDGCHLHRTAQEYLNALGDLGAEIDAETRTKLESREIEEDEEDDDWSLT